MNRSRTRAVAAFVALVTVAMLLLVTIAGVAGAAAAAPGLKAAPLNPEFLQYQKDLAAGRLSRTSGGSALGLLPAPLDLSYLNRLAVPGTANAYPATYDLRTTVPVRVTPAKDQGNNGTCWAFATMGSLESCLLLPPGTTTYDFSEDNMVLTNGFDVATGGSYETGGGYPKSTAYLARWGGPMLESQDAYHDGNTPPGLTPSKHVQEVLWLPGRTGTYGIYVHPIVSAINMNAVKAAVTQHGGVWTGIHVGSSDQSTYFNDTYDSWYYPGTSGTDHAVLIVGWDDAYSRTKFAVAPPGDGAFIVKNSWGAGWGENGYFHVSYYDSQFGDSMACFDNAEATSNYKTVYQYDRLGVEDTVGWGDSTTAWFANVFTASASDSMAAVSFYAMAPGASYQVYAGATLAGKALKTSGTLTYAGYYTIKLPTPMALTSGQKFAVAVKVTTPGLKYPIPCEYPVATYSSAATAAASQSYISNDGATWYDLTAQTGFEKANVCLKAFTKAAVTATRYQETDAKLTYSPAWTAVTNAGCSGGSMRTRNAAGSVTATFTGTGVSVVSTKGPAYGKLKLTLDGVVQPTVDLYAAAVAYQQKVYIKSGLANAAHTLKLEWTGTKNAAATATTVDLDALDVTGTLTQAPSPTTRYEQTDSRLRYLGTWSNVSGASCSGGSQKTINAAGGVYVTFTGTQVGLVATKGSAYGKLKLTLDGVVQPTVDLYAAAVAYQQKVFTKSGLASAAHTLLVEWAGAKNAAATGTTVNFDAIEILGSLTQAPDLTGGLVGSWSYVGYTLAEMYTFQANGTYVRVMIADGDFIKGMLTQEGLYIAKGGAIKFFDGLESWTPDADDPSGIPAYTDEPLAAVQDPYRLEDAGATLVITEDGSDSYYDKN